MPSIRVRRSTYSSLRAPDLQASAVSQPTHASGAAPNISEPEQRHDKSAPNSDDERLPLSDDYHSTSRVHHHLRRTTLRPRHGHRRPSLPSFQDKDKAGHHRRPRSGTTGGEVGRGSGYASVPFHIDGNDHHDDIVDHLEVIDPRFSTASNLTYAANSVIFPPLPLDLRKPTLSIPITLRSPPGEEGRSLHEDELDRHVEDCLTRRQQIRRTLQGVWAFIKTPLGFFAAFYAFNIIFWGAGIVFFLGKIINLHNAEQQGYWVELTCQVETGLFTLTSVGLIPWRILDTWRIYWIWYYKRKTIRLRKRLGIPQLTDLDDLPDPVYDDRFVRVLTDKEHVDLHYQQMQFMKSQNWYRPHATSTHHAFPIATALWICVLNDWNSIFQIGLNACMWGLNRCALSFCALQAIIMFIKEDSFQRPAATTGTLLPAGFICGIGSAVLIWRGTQSTKRTELVEERLRAALTSEDKSEKGRHPPSTKP